MEMFRLFAYLLPVREAQKLNAKICHDSRGSFSFQQYATKREGGKQTVETIKVGVSYWHFFILVVFHFACSKEISIEIPEKQPKLVIEATLVPYSANGKHLGVTVKTSRHIFDTSSAKPITNAEVLIFKNGGLLVSPDYDSIYQFYPLGFGPMQGPLAGETYRIEVSAPGYKKVFAETHIPEKVLIDTITIDRIGYFDDSGLVYSKLTISFTDPPEEDNYYEIVVTSIGMEYRASAYRALSTFEPFIVNEPHYPDETRIDLKNPNRLLFNDKTFNGQQTELDLYYFASQRLGVTHLLNSEILSVQLRNISYEYYLYQSTMLHSSFNREADILYGLGEPLNVISNIENGYGIFAGFNNDVHHLELDTLTVWR